MTQFVFLAATFNGIVLPLIALFVLLASKLASEKTARKSERRFLAVLILMTLVTAHTVIHNDPLWLIHTVTLSVMVIGSLWIPGEHRVSHAGTSASTYVDTHSQPATTNPNHSFASQ